MQLGRGYIIKSFTITALVSQATLLCNKNLKSAEVFVYAISLLDATGSKLACDNCTHDFFTNSNYTLHKKKFKFK